MPLHPLLVHFPIALLITATLIELFAWKFRDKLNLTGTIILTAGFITGIAAFMTGDSGERFAEMHFGEVDGMIHLHEKMALTSMIIFGAAVLLKLYTHFSSKFIKEILIVVTLLCMIGTGFLAYTGHLGGKIVYENDKVMNTQINQGQDQDKD